MKFIIAALLASASAMKMREGQDLVQMQEISHLIDEDTLLELEEQEDNMAQGFDRAMNNAAVVAHNAKRAKHHAPAMHLDENAARLAQNWAQTMTQKGFGHSPRGARNNCGENIAAGQRSIQAATDAWYNEVKDYDYSHPGFNHKTGHFTQVVWVGSTGLGCGEAKGKMMGYNMSFWACQYCPAGNMNMPGYFEKNVLRP